MSSDTQTAAKDSTKTETVVLPPKAENLLNDMRTGIDNSFNLIKGFKDPVKRKEKIEAAWKDAEARLINLLSVRGVEGRVHPAAIAKFKKDFDAKFKPIMPK